MESQASNKKEQWSMPKFDLSKQGITVWNTKSLAAAPEISRTLRTMTIPDRPADNSEDILAKQTWAEYMDLEDTAKLLHRPDRSDLRRWLWTCRIFVRLPDRDLPNPTMHAKYGTGWIKGTAYLVNEVHEDGSTDQWLLTVAHNLSTIVYKCDNEGTIIDMDAKARSAVVADAIYVVLGWGDNERGAWVDKVAVMSDFLADIKGVSAQQKFDGAALRIMDSPIYSDFWTEAPPLGYVVPTEDPTSQMSRFLIPGFPGQINDFEDLAGLYLAGNHTGKGSDYGDFGPVQVNVEAAGNSFAGSLSWDQDACHLTSGQSGSPCVIVGDKGPLIIASVNTTGVGAPFMSTAVDPWALLGAIGADTRRCQHSSVPIATKPAPQEKASEGGSSRLPKGDGKSQKIEDDNSSTKCSIS